MGGDGEDIIVRTVNEMGRASEWYGRGGGGDKEKLRDDDGGKLMKIQIKNNNKKQKHDPKVHNCIIVRCTVKYAAAYLSLGISSEYRRQKAQRSPANSGGRTHRNNAGSVRLPGRGGVNLDR